MVDELARAAAVEALEAKRSKLISRLGEQGALLSVCLSASARDARAFLHEAGAHEHAAAGSLPPLLEQAVGVEATSSAVQAALSSQREVGLRLGLGLKLGL